MAGGSFADIQPLGKHGLELGHRTHADFLKVPIRPTVKQQVVGAIREDDAIEWVAST